MNFILSAIVGIICGILGIISWEYMHNRKSRKQFEFSKALLLGVMVTYFVGVVVGVWAVMAVSVEQLGVLLTYIGSPVVVAIGFYSWKSKAENMIKLKKEHPDETSEIPIDLNSIQ